MKTGRNRLGWNLANSNSPLHLVVLVCFVAAVSYLAGRLAGELALSPPMIWPFWPVCALLVSVLLLVPTRIWPLLMAAAFAAVALYDIQTGVPIGSIVWFISDDTVEVLTAAFCLRYFFNGIPRLNSLRALAKYSFFAVLLAPFAGTFLAAFGFHGNYWTSWSTCFLSEVLAFVTLTPAILCWVNEGPGFAKKSGAYYLEGAALIGSLGFLGYISLAAPGRSGSPALVYALVPLLLWSALRFGSLGASTSVVVVTLLSIWGAVHGRGPFTEPNPVSEVLSLQLFIFFAVIPFMVLAALVEERKRAEKKLLGGEERFRLATQAGKMFAYEWDANSDLLVRSTGSAQIIGIDEATPTTGREILARIHSDDQQRVLAAIGELSPEKPYLEISYRMVRPDGDVIWVQRSSRAQFDEQGKMVRMIGMVADITERKLAQERLGASEERLRLAVQAGKMFACDWDAATEVFAHSPGSAQILGIDEGRPITSNEILGYIYPDDRERFTAAAAELSPDKPDIKISHRMVRPDGTVIWVERNSRGQFDEQGKIVRIVGIVADITERKRAEQELALTNDRLRMAMEAGKSVGWEWDIKSGRDSWFGDLKTMFGVSSDAFVGRPEDFYRYVHPEDREMVAKAVAEARLEKKPYAAEFRVVWPDKTVRWVAAKGKFNYSPDGEAERMLGMAVDITERRNAEESLRLFRTLIDQSNDAIEVINPETMRLLDVNEKACRELGYTREELLSLRIHDIDPTLSKTSHAKARKNVEETGFALFESIHRRKDGSTFPVEVNAKHVELDRIYYVTVVRDITERKRAEQALRESEERLRLAVKAGRMYAFEWDKATDLIVRSGEGGDTLNWISDQTIHTGRQFVARVYPADREAYAISETGLTAENPSYQINYRMLRPDGSVIWLEESGHAFFDGQGKMLKTIGIVADVTERKIAEEALRESEQRFGLVANSAPVMIWMSGVDKLCTFFNAVWLNFTGRSMEQELGEGWAHGVHTDDLERCIGIYSTAFDARVDFEVEYRLRRFDGEYRWIVDLGVPRFGADGTFCGYIGSCVDITDRKLAETSLLELSGRLIHAQEKERTRIARELHDDLSQRLALLQIGLDQFGLDEGALSPQARQQLSNISVVAAEISSNIHELSHTLHPSKLDTLGLLPSLRALCKELSNRYSLEVQFVHHGVLDGVSRDVSLCLFRIVQEALRNVVKHSGATEAQVELSAHADRIDLSIFDTGTGFNPEAVKGCLGLGLVSMRERLRLVGGQFSVESKPAQGTRIIVRVPLSGTNGQGTVEQKHYEANA
jgi:PAS domain S-box-containing protein